MKININTIKLKRLHIESSISRKRNLISSFVVSFKRRSNFGIFMTFFSKTSALFTSGCHSSHFSVFVDWIADPVDSRVVPDSVMIGVNTNDFIEFMSSVFSYPIGVKDSESSAVFSDTLLGNGSEISGEFELSNTLTGWFSVDNALGNGSLSTTSSDLHSVNNVSLFGLVTQTSGLIWARWVGTSVDNWQLTIFPSSDT